MGTETMIVRERLLWVKLAPGILMISTANPAVLAVLALIILWLFVRPGRGRDRLFLLIAALVYVAGMAATFWKFGTAEKGRLIESLLLESIGMILVTLSRRLGKGSKKSISSEVSLR